MTNEPPGVYWLLSQYESVVRRVRALCGNRASAEDLTQDLMVRLRFGRVLDPERPEQWWAYVHIAIRRYVWDWKRLLQREQEALEAFAGQAQFATISSCSTEATETGQTLRAAVLDLPPNQREAIEFCVLGDLSPERAAYALGCDPSTVRRRCGKGVATLRLSLASTVHSQRIAA